MVLKLVFLETFGLEINFVATPQIQDYASIKVKDFMHVEGKHWKEPLLNNLFPAPTVAAILRTPICELVEHDTRVWWPSKSGAYEVRSA